MRFAGLLIVGMILACFTEEGQPNVLSYSAKNRVGALLDEILGTLTKDATQNRGNRDDDDDDPECAVEWEPCNPKPDDKTWKGEICCLKPKALPCVEMHPPFGTGYRCEGRRDKRETMFASRNRRGIPDPDKQQVAFTIKEELDGDAVHPRVPLNEGEQDEQG